VRAGGQQKGEQKPVNHTVQNSIKSGIYCAAGAKRGHWLNKRPVLLVYRNAYL
jgi:hypothetical protein